MRPTKVKGTFSAGAGFIPKKQEETQVFKQKEYVPSQDMIRVLQKANKYQNPFGSK